MSAVTGMDVAIADDTIALVGAAVDAFATPDAQRTRRSRDLHEGFEAAVWQEFARLGWLSASLPEARGGLGLGMAATARIAQRLGYAGYFEPYVTAGAMPLAALVTCGGSEAARLIDAIIAGRTLVTIAWQPPDGRFGTDDTAVVATARADGLALDGECRFVSVPQAQAFIVSARRDGVPLLAIIDADQRGVTLQRERAADGSSLARIGLRGVYAARVLAEGPEANVALDQAVRVGIVATAAELLGVMERALELTLAYVKERRQFGQPIGAFQVLQHRAVDMWIQQELTRAALRSAVARCGETTAPATLQDAAASGVKARASQAALYVCGQAVQLHGAIGFTDEYPLGHYVNRALVLAARFGSAAQHRRRFARLMKPMPGASEANA